MEAAILLLCSAAPLVQVLAAMEPLKGHPGWVLDGVCSYFLQEVGPTVMLSSGIPCRHPLCGDFLGQEERESLQKIQFPFLWNEDPLFGGHCGFRWGHHPYPPHQAAGLLTLNTL